MCRLLFRAPMAAAILALAGLLTFAGVGTAHAEDESHYTYQELPPLPSSPFAQVPSLSINNKGHVLAKGLDQHAYLFKDGSWTDQGFVGQSILHLNDSDEFAFANFPDQVGFGFNGSIQLHTITGSVSTQVVALSDSGDVTGNGRFGNTELPFILRGNTFRKLRGPNNAGPDGGSATDRNELGASLEGWDLSSSFGYFVRSAGGAFRRLSNLAAVFDLNDEGAVLAAEPTPPGSLIQPHGSVGTRVFVDSRGRHRKLAAGLNPLALNNNGRILGFNGSEFLVDNEGTIEHNAVPAPVSLVGRGFTEAAGFVFLQTNGKIVIARHNDEVKVKFKYETVDATETGLNPRRVHEAALEGVQIELRDESDQVVGHGRTNQNGEASIGFPLDLNGKFRVVAVAQTDEAVVVPPGANSSTFEVVSRPFHLVPGNSDPHELLATDRKRENGPFAILETLRSASKFMQDNAPGFEPRSIGVVWNVRSGEAPHILPGSIRLGGLRTLNSDEFDADVVTTAWMREELSFNPSLGFGGDGQGGLDLVNGAPFRLETPLAFVDGFAAFAAAARADSTGGNATGRLVNTRRRTFVTDLENPQIQGREQGPYDPISVAALLWDLYDNSNEGDDKVGFGFSELWSTLLSFAPSFRPTMNINLFCERLGNRNGTELSSLIKLTEQQNGVDPEDDNFLTYPPVVFTPVDNLIDPNAHALALSQDLLRSAEGVQDYLIPALLAAGKITDLTVDLSQDQPTNDPQLIGVTVQLLDAQTLQPRQPATVVTPATSGNVIAVQAVQPNHDVLVRITSSGAGRRATFAKYELTMSLTAPFR